jgi:hypothetical protein
LWRFRNSTKVPKELNASVFSPSILIIEALGFYKSWVHLSETAPLHVSEYMCLHCHSSEKLSLLLSLLVFFKSEEEATIFEVNKQSQKLNSEVSTGD